MITKEKLELLKPRFPGYTSAMIEAHATYYKTCDPVFFLRIAAQFETPTYKTQPLGGEEHDLLHDNEERIEATRASFLRYLRYLAAERLILLLVAGYPLGPAPRTFSSVKFKKLNKLLDALSKKQVPDDMSISVSGVELDYDSWIKQLGFHGVAVGKGYVADLGDFIAKEATFIGNREVINAFKHGRAQAPLSGQAFQVQVGEGEDKQPLFKSMEGAVQWLGWSDETTAQSLRHTLILGFEETNADADYQLIKTIVALEKLIVDLRRAVIEGDEVADVHLPNLSTEASQHFPNRISLNLSTTWTPQRKAKE